MPTPVEEKTVEPVPTVYQSEVLRVVATSQQRKGDYYIMPILGFLRHLDYHMISLLRETNLVMNRGSWGNS